MQYILVLLTLLVTMLATNATATNLTINYSIYDSILTLLAENIPLRTLLKIRVDDASNSKQ